MIPDRFFVEREDMLDNPLIWVRAVHFAATILVSGIVFCIASIAAPAFCKIGGNSKHQAVNAIEGHSLRRFAPEHIELVSKNQDFRLKPCSRPQQPRQRACHTEKIYHRERTAPDSRLLASRLRFPVGTAHHLFVFHL
jgi:hypothetical protein